MDDKKKKQIENGVREEFRVGRARLFRVETERKVRAEIAEDRNRIFAAFKQLGLEKELELTQGLGRLLINFSKLASYRGVLEGYHLFRTGIKLGEDHARFYLVEYLQMHPDAENSELVRYLDRKNGRLSVLKTNQNDPLWAWLPRSWNEEFRNRGITLREGEFWEMALKEFPELVMPYLSRAKKMAKEARVRNVLFSWPQIIKEHKKRRKKGGNAESNPD
ncbi:MAG: hypothetical protein ACLPLR_01750 [Terriglobales bacterium]